MGQDRRVFVFAHPAYCPECRAPRTPAERCPRCGLLLQGGQADRLYALLAEADEVLSTLRAASDATMPASPTPPATLAPGSPAAASPGTASPSPPGDRTDRAPDAAYLLSDAAQAPLERVRRVTAGSVLLALGALLLVVAGTVFVAVAWGSLSLAARTVLLLGVTVLFGTGAVLCLVRRLRASTEALWGVTALLLLVDVAAAYAAGLGPLDDLSTRGLVTAWALALGLPSVPVGVLARRRWDADVGRLLVAAESLVVTGALLGAVALAVDWGPDPVWLPVAVLGLLAAVAVVVRGTGLAVAATGVAGLAAIAYVVAAVAAAGEVADRPRVGRLFDGSGGSSWPALLLLVLSVAAAVAVRARWQAQLAVTGVAVGLVAALVLLPAGAAGTVPLVLVAAALVVGLAGAGVLPVTGAVLAARIGGTLGAVGLGVGLLPFVADGLGALVTVTEDVWARDWGVRLPGVAIDDTWLALVLGAALAATAVLAVRWPWEDAPPELRRAGPGRERADADGDLGAAAPVDTTQVLLTLASLSLVGGAVTVLLTVSTPVAVLTGLGVLGCAAAARARRPPLLLPAVGLAALGAVASAASASLSAVALLAVAAGLLAAAALRRHRSAATALTVLGVPVATLGVVAVAHALGADGDLAPLVVVVTVAVLAQAAGTAVGLLPTLRTGWTRPGEGAEVAAALALPVTVLLAGESATRAAVSLTVLGVAAALTGVLRVDRRPARWVGLVLLQVAWTVRLLDTEVETVEVYTLPAGLVLVGAGLWAMRGDRAVRTWTALLPGLSLAVLPSLPQAVAHVTSTRAWLVGAGAAVLVALAIRLRWAAPLAVGSLTVSLLALAHLVSAAGAVPRWVTIATVGAALVGAGITWESRVRDARALAAYVGDLR